MVLFTFDYSFENHDISYSSLTVDVDWFMKRIVRLTSIIMTEEIIVYTHAVKEVFSLNWKYNRSSFCFLSIRGDVVPTFVSVMTNCLLSVRASLVVGNLFTWSAGETILLDKEWPSPECPVRRSRQGTRVDQAVPSARLASPRHPVNIREQPTQLLAVLV